MLERFFLLPLLCSPALAQPIPKDCSPTGWLKGTIEEGGKSSNFRLKGNAQTYFLSHLLANDEPVRAGPVQLAPINKKPDRYGRIAVQLLRIHGKKWVQKSLIEQGKAQLSGRFGMDDCSKVLLDSESMAREHSRGLWANRTIHQANHIEELETKNGHFVLVEGKVLSIGNRSNRLYLNFGKNWSQDFTVTIAKKGGNAFKGNWKQLLTLKNKTIRVRGWLENRGGPLMRLVYEGQLERVGN